MTFRRMKAEQLETALNKDLQKQTDPTAAYADLPEEELFTLADFDHSRAERGGYSNYSYWGATLRAFFKNKVAVFFLCVIAVVLLFTFIQPLLPN